MRHVGMSVDPGSVHVGVAIWFYDPEARRWFCEKAYETTPVEYADYLRTHVEQDDFEWVAMESFHLFGNKAMQQSGSTFGEVELIGLTRHMTRWHAIPFKTVDPSVRDATYVKAKARGYQFSANPGDEGHSHSATSVGLQATGWTAASHLDGDGVGRHTG